MAVVIDNGTCFVHTGIAGEENPTYTFPSIVGKDNNTNQTFVGTEAQEKRHHLAIRNVVENGIITKWEEIQEIWHFSFKKLHKKIEEQPVLMIGAPSQPVSNREKITEILFENFGASSILTAAGELMSLYGSGRTEGMVINCGATFRIVPVHEGFILPHSVLISHFGGKDITDYLCQLLDNKLGTELTYREKYNQCEIIKRTRCYSCENFIDENKKQIQEEYVLPDKSTITLGSELFQCTEAFFKPELVGRHINEGFQHSLIGFVRSLCCDVDIRRALLENIMLIGGSASIPGFSTRFANEVEKHTQKQWNCSFLPVDNNPDLLPWRGGSVMASLENFKNSWFTKEQYDEEGAAGIHNFAVFG